jgi:hypothetical protein
MDRCVLVQSDLHEEHDLPPGNKKRDGDIIHAEGVRVVVSSSAPPVRNVRTL